MSNALAIASVTYVLKDLLNNGLIDQDISGIVNGNVKVSSLPPDKINLETITESRLNLFMYRVTPNLGWRNIDLPSRDSRGERATNPPLALDLHYLLTAYGVNELHSEVLLGYGMQLLHETPVLGRVAIRSSLSPAIVSGGSLPAELKALKTSKLAEQAEQIKITPAALNTEEISKLWAAFQSKFRPSAGFLVSVVLIESTQQARSPLPVLSRGRPDPVSGRDEGVIVVPDLIPPFPTLEKVNLPKQQVVAKLDDTIGVTGHHLDGTNHKVFFTNSRMQINLEANILPGNTANEISVKLSDAVDPDSPATPHKKNWATGFYNIAVRLIRPSETHLRSTNDISFSLASKIDMPINISKGTDNKVTFTVKCQPDVRPEQTASLLVSDREIAANSLTAASDTLKFEAVLPAEMLVTGKKHYVRLRIDGVDSILINRSKAPPEFDISQQITMP